MRRRALLASVLLDIPDTPDTPDMPDYLTIEALEDGLTASLSVNVCEYCVDGDDNWKTLTANTATESINTGQTLSFRGNLTPTSSNGIGTFTISKKCNLKGNCMSMLFGDNAADNFSLSGKNYAFSNLFNGCTNIINVSSNFLPATTLATYCYYNMFQGCSSLTTAPELPAKSLEDVCYNSMFYGCTNLTTAPELPATTLKQSCYTNMFRNCSKLNYIKMLATDISAYNCLGNWVSGVASSGTFVKNLAMNSHPTGDNGIPSGWTVVNDGGPIINIDNYLTIEARENGLTVSLSTNACEYCVDGDGNWKTLSAGTATESINSGHTLSFRGELIPYGESGIGTFTISKKCNLKGNCMSMIFGDNAADNYSLEGKNYAFRKLFYNCTNVVNVSSNFLPATTLVSHCYFYMFKDCTSLTTAPELPATTLSYWCYYYMFNGCSNLNYIKMLATDISASNCLSGWVNGVATTGTFVKHPDMTTLPTATSSNNYAGIPSGWTVVDDGEESGG